MKRNTRIALWVNFVTIAICVPGIVTIEIVRNANWWAMLHLAWAVGIELFILVLLSQKPIKP